MRIVYRAENVVDAHLVRGALEQAGIRAHVTGEFLTGGMGELPAAGLVAVMVDENDLADAERCLADLAAARADAEREPDLDLDAGADAPPGWVVRPV